VTAAVSALRRICVFCGSNRGADPAFAAAAECLGRELSRRGIGLVYGGGNVGLMGVLADTVLAGGGHVTGVIPEALMAREVGHRGLPDLRVVKTMHERKALMADLADGFIALPGGMGTFEEFLEVVAWAQLGFHAKPCALLNVNGYFDPLLRFLDHAVEQRFIRPTHRSLVRVGSDIGPLLEQMRRCQAPGGNKWIDQDVR
jgi:uncharacterized protein (TIGR00730 family)